MQGLIISVVILAVIGLVIWFTQRRQQIDEAAFTQLAQSNGWQYQKSYELSQLGSGNVLRYRFSPGKPNGENWTLDIESAASGGGAGGSALQSTIWRSDKSKLSEGLLLIGPRPKDLPPNLDLGEMFTQMALQTLLRATLGSEAPDTSRLREVKNCSHDLLRHALVFATNETMLPQLLTAPAEATFLELTRGMKERQRPAVVFWGKGIQIKCAGLITDAVNLQKIVALGKALKGGSATH